MKVHEAATALGVTPRTLRFYEEKGLISPPKDRENGYRIFAEEDLNILRWIVALREFGIPLDQIKEIISCTNESNHFLREMDKARSILYAKLTDTIESLRAFDETISEIRLHNTAKFAPAKLAAERLNQQRKLRATWHDRWNYDELVLDYGDDAPIVALSDILDLEQYDQALRRTAEWVDSSREESGLELGPGSGNLTRLLGSTGARLTVVEQSAEMIARLRNRLPQVDARLGNLLQLPLNDISFDFVASSFAMHHLNGSQQLLALNEMDQVLRSGGRLIITCLSKHVSDDKRMGITSPLFPDWMSWLQQRQYSVVTEQLTDSIGILYGLKP